MDATDQSVLERQIRISARPEIVFSFFTDPVKLIRWKGVRAELDPRPGGIYRVEINERDIVLGKYVEIVPFTRIVFTWGWEGENSPLPPGSTTVEIDLIPDGEGTIVRLLHLGLPPELRDVHAQGWDHFLPRLGQAAAGQQPGADPWSM
jgi:uncharacterized protein YndB with AHSA1/START domain